jgi:hypothetical protein
MVLICMRRQAIRSGHPDESSGVKGAGWGGGGGRGHCWTIDEKFANN